MSVIDALILGIVQGLTEFLPVSSSGHIELGAHLLSVNSSDNLLFSIIVHGATALSTLVIFRKDVALLAQDLFKFEWNESTRFIAKIALSMIPVAFVGILLEDRIEALFTGKVLLVAGMLCITGVLLLLTYFIGQKEKEISFGRSFLIGLSQAAAIFPGISRSGATIATALLLGVKKTEAARFSFLMVLPPILGASLLKAIDYFKTPEMNTDIPAMSLIIGFISAFIAGVVACQWMISIVKRGKLIYFAIYCFAVSALVFTITLL
ncbi:undecaprenyl-diphosphate phosphatase [Fulvivirga sp. M361]|uniref:undecaprenyl-diphosphate phosphatase n=1 Tax=Fulvivirga sp. M361 TaxID=2594266 RepID=UPI00117BB815|nr:undecaprenyl-diphosphate phosphatase [Fulvivirga sp. M361]TRX49470.1 undecaprenyl-diphosphate phosphatase [Fulvivirga sp. M361]